MLNEFCPMLESRRFQGKNKRARWGQRRAGAVARSAVPASVGGSIPASSVHTAVRRHQTRAWEEAHAVAQHHVVLLPLRCLRADNLEYRSW